MWLRFPTAMSSASIPVLIIAAGRSTSARLRRRHGALCLMDADLLAPPDFLRRGLEQMQSGKRAIRPYSEVLYLDEPSTVRAIEDRWLRPCTGGGSTITLACHRIIRRVAPPGSMLLCITTWAGMTSAFVDGAARIANSGHVWSAPQQSRLGPTVYYTSITHRHLWRIGRPRQTGCARGLKSAVHRPPARSATFPDMPPSGLRQPRLPLQRESAIGKLGKGGSTKRSSASCTTNCAHRRRLADDANWRKSWCASAIHWWT